MIKTTGSIEAKSKDGKRFKMDDGNWYSAFATSQINGCTNGDYVEFTYTSKPSPDGGTYRNVKGNLTKLTPPASAPMTAGGVTGSAEKKYTDSRGYVIKEFPLPAFHPDRSIIRQNSLSHACEILGTYGVVPSSVEAYAEQAIAVARLFEAYSAGDLDVAIVEAEMKLLTAKETS